MKVKIYIVVCRYPDVDIELNTIFNRLRLPPDKEDSLDKVVRFNVENKYPCEYIVKQTFARVDCVSEKYNFGWSLSECLPRSVVIYLASSHNNFYIQASEKEFEEYVRGYGYNYTKQIRGIK